MGFLSIKLHNVFAIRRHPLSYLYICYRKLALGLRKVPVSPIMFFLHHTGRRFCIHSVVVENLVLYIVACIVRYAASANVENMSCNFDIQDAGDRFSFV